MVRRRRDPWDDDTDVIVEQKVTELKEGIKKAMSGTKIWGVFIGVMVGIGLILVSMLIGTNKAGWILVKQAAWTGELSAIFKEGVYPRFFADIEQYPLTAHFYFSRYNDEGKAQNESIEVTFRNGSVGHVSGSCRYAYPGSQDPMLALHRRYHNDNAVKADLVRTTIRNLVGMTASLMSPEAAMTQKGLFYQMLQDQIEHGQYQTIAAKETFTDPITKEVTVRDVVEVARDETTKIPLRLENPLEEFHIKVDQLVIQDIDPDTVTKEMIGKRRDAEMNIMVAKANTERANEEAKTVQAQGAKSVVEREYKALEEKKVAVVNAQREKEVAETKAQQEKSVAVTAAQREVEVNTKAFEAAEWKRKTAEQEKLAMIERGMGEARARELAMAADGALKMKLDTYEKVMAKFAEAFAARKVPEIVMGGGQGASGDNQAMEFIQMLSLKAAKDLAADMEMGNKRK